MNRYGDTKSPYIHQDYTMMARVKNLLSIEIPLQQYLRIVYVYLS